MTEIKRLYMLQEALEIEKKHEIELYKNLISSSSIHDLVEKGSAWYPLQIIESGYTLGEYPYLTLEINPEKMKNHSFKAGEIIDFFQNEHGNFQQHSCKATIYYLNHHQAKIILDTDEFPEWYHEGKIGFVKSYDEKSQKEMELALNEVIKAARNELAAIRDQFYFPKKTEPIFRPFTANNLSLNPSQIRAIEAILGDNLVTIVHGPPGTGKTTTLVEAIIQKTKRNQKILVSAPSNSAVDLLVEKLAAYHIDVLRIGNISRINETIIHHTIEYKIESSPAFQEIKKLRKRGDEYRRMANKYHRKYGKEEREQRNSLLKEAKDCQKHCRYLEDFLIDKILSSASVICTTLVGVQNHRIKDLHFDTAFIDEVSQALEPATWIPMLKSSHVVLAGDPHQLPPTVKSIEASKKGLDTTLLDIGFNNQDFVFLLNTQYRMYPDIMGFSNLYFYNNQLIAAPNTLTHQYMALDQKYKPILFIDTAGCGFEEQVNSISKSYFNPDEYILIRNHLTKTLQDLYAQYDAISVGIISPYKEQVNYIKTMYREEITYYSGYNIDIQTIDSFQGQERDIIYISLVRSNSDQEIGFLKDYRRMNVAMTRAKSILVVIGDSTTLSKDPFYNQWIEYCEQHQYYSSAWEFLEI